MLLLLRALGLLLLVIRRTKKNPPPTSPMKPSAFSSSSSGKKIMIQTLYDIIHKYTVRATSAQYQEKNWNLDSTKNNKKL